MPEIHNGTVEIKAIAREAGSRSKVAVWSRQEGLDPVGATVGQRGARVQAVVAELAGEKIDVIPWNDDPAVFVANALSPAQVLDVQIDEEHRIASVTVPERMLSLAIGREGQNARLAAKLSGWRIDIRSDVSVAEAARVAEDAAARPCGDLAERRRGTRRPPSDGGCAPPRPPPGRAPSQGCRGSRRRTRRRPAGRRPKAVKPPAKAAAEAQATPRRSRQGPGQAQGNASQARGQGPASHDRGQGRRPSLAPRKSTDEVAS